MPGVSAIFPRMARPLRIERPGGRFHVTARGNDRRDIFRDDTDRHRFLDLLNELPGLFGIRIHAYVLMDNHFHLVVETPRPTLSRSMQWLGVSYTMWFNRRHRRSGHLFQGRFKSVMIEDDAGLQEVARYAHLNPARVARLGQSKSDRAASKAGMIRKPDAQVVSQRLNILRDYKWSSYRGYAGYCQQLDWVWSEPLDRLCGGRGEAEKRKALRDYTEEPLREGVVESPWDRLIGGLVLGSEAFARSVRMAARGSRREQPQMRRLERPVSWGRIVEALERLKGEKWKVFAGRYGDWGRDAALWLGRRHGGLRLGELGRLAGGMDYAAVAQAMRRFGRRIKEDAVLRRGVEKLEHELSKVTM